MRNRKVESVLICETLVKFASSGVTFLWFVALLTLYTVPVTRYEMLRDVFRWFSGLFLGDIPEPADNVFE